MSPVLRASANLTRLATPSGSIRTSSPEERPQTGRRLRVLQVVLSLDPGGTERLVIDIAKALAPSVDAVVCCLDQPGAWASELTESGVPVIALRREPGFQPDIRRRIARIADEHRIDVLHCHHYSPFIYGQLAALMRRKLAVVFTEHGRLSDAKPSLKRRLVNPFIGRLPAAIFAVSADLRLHMIAEGLPGSRVRVVHNGISLPAKGSARDRWAARQALGIPSDAFVIGTAGRLDPVKDLPTLIDGFAAAGQGRTGMRLVIIGDGPEREQLAQHANARGVGAAAIFTGYRNDVRRLLPAFDVYANSSTHEGVSLTILEAMASSLPVVATAVGGTPEVVIDGETGLLIPARSPMRLAAAVEKLARAPGLRRTMGEAARFRVRTHFSVETMVTSYLHAYYEASRAD